MVGSKAIWRYLAQIPKKRYCIFFLWCFKVSNVDTSSRRLVMDWTTLQENFLLLSISLVTKKGRTIPIAYDGYKQGELGEGRRQSSIEVDLIKKNIGAIPMPSRKRITVVADRGFDRPDLAELLISLKVNFVIRVWSGEYITVEGKEIEIAKKNIIRPV